MFLLVRTDGSVEPLPGVASIENDGKEVLCLDGTGAIVHRYVPQEVMLYGQEAKILPLLREMPARSTSVEKLLCNGDSEPCCARLCQSESAIVFVFEGTEGGLRLGLCESHQALVNEQTRKVMLDGLDLHRVTIQTAS